MYAPNAAMDAAWEKEVGPQGDEMELEETWLHGDRANQQATQLLGGYARNVDLHKKVAAALRARTITAADVTGAVSKASSSSHVKQLLGLKS